MTLLPYSFEEARQAVIQASRAQQDAELFRAEKIREAADAEKAYRLAVARKIIELREQGWPATVCQDLARGDSEVAELQRLRSITEGLAATAEQSLWRHTADRRSLDELVRWSMRVAPDGQAPAHMERAA